MSQESRAQSFQRVDALESLLDEINGALGPAEAMMPLPDRPALPVLFVVGAPRSGTTLLMQWLAASGAVAWPSNLISRFYAAPYLGARVQQLLVDPRFNYRDELATVVEPAAFSSDLGKTQGLLQPNEFWYFWRRFFPVQWPQRLSDDEMRQSDSAGFVRGLAAIEAAFAKPFAAKALLLQFNIAFLAEILPNAIFISVERDPMANASSLLAARRRYWNDESKWYSVRPPGFESLLGMQPLEQVAGQVLLTQSSIRRQLSDLSDCRKVHVRYEAFCESTERAWDEIRERLRDIPAPVPTRHPGPQRFDVATQPPDFDHRRWEQALGAISHILGESMP